MNIHVGNFNNNLIEEDLKQLFTPYGEVVSVRIVKDTYTRQSRGYGFIIMANDTEALKAIAGLNNLQFHHKVLTVSKARPTSNYKLS